MENEKSITKNGFDTIIVLEDDNLINKLIWKKLSTEGYKVFSAYTANEAIEKIEYNKNSLLLLDYNLPDMTGEDMIDVLIEKNTLVPFVMITGIGDEKVAVRMMKKGAYDYIVKDNLFIDTLLSVIKRVSKQLVTEKNLNVAIEELARSEEKYKAIATNVSDIICLLNAEGIITYLSPSVLDITGYDYKELIGIPFTKLIYHEDAPFVRDFFKTNTSDYQQVNRLEYRILSKKGNIIWLETVFKYIKNNSQKLIEIHTISRDITQKVIAEQRLRESKELYQKLLSAMPDIVLITDMNFKLQWTNDMGLKYLGNDVTLKDVAGINLLSIIVEDDREKAVINTKKMFEGKVPPQEYRVYTPTNREAIFELHGEILRDENNIAYGLINVCRDITERKRTEFELKQSQEKFKEIFENIQDVYYETTIDGTLIEISPSIQKVTGLKREELIGKSIINFYANNDDRIKLVKLLYEDGEINDYEIDLINTNNERLNCSISCIVKHEGNDSIPRIIGSIRDISLRKRAETKIKELNANLEKIIQQRTFQLEQSNKELEAFSYSVSHDLRAPLRSISGFSQALVEDFSETLGNDGKDFLNRIISSCAQMTQLIDDLLNLSRISRLGISKDNVNLSSISNEIIKDFYLVQPERKINFKIQNNIIVIGDLHLLKIVMQNLIENAWKYTSKKDVAEIEVGSYLENDNQIIYIKDNGVGFEMKYAAKLFGVFQRMHSSKEFPGTGIGLSTVQRIIFRHEGKIWADSKLNEGTTFFFTLRN